MRTQPAGWLAALALSGCLAETQADQATQNETQKATQGVAQAVARARSLAAQQRRNVEFSIFPDERKFVTAQETAPGVFTQKPEFEFRLSEDYTVTVEGEARRGALPGERVLSFTPAGTTQAAQIKVTHKRGAWRVLEIDAVGHLNLEEQPLE